MSYAQADARAASRADNLRPRFEAGELENVRARTQNMNQTWLRLELVLWLRLVLRDKIRSACAMKSEAPIKTARFQFNMVRLPHQ
jgi:hypothetical protein